jgi:hypothetical protein
MISAFFHIFIVLLITWDEKKKITWDETFFCEKKQTFLGAFAGVLRRITKNFHNRDGV